MSITVRLWNQQTLDNIKTGKDKFLTTVFMNAKTFSEHEIQFYPYHLRHTFLCEWLPEGDSTRVYATDIKNLRAFLEAEYTRLPDYITEVITTHKAIQL